MVYHIYDGGIHGIELYTKLNGNYLYWEDNTAHGCNGNRMCIYQASSVNKKTRTYNTKLPWLPFTATQEDIEKLMVLL
jgi:hypothetical protein